MSSTKDHDNKIKLTLIRHGKTKSNMEGRYLGQADETLTLCGAEEIYRLDWKHVYDVPDRVFISPMLRCRETAEILFPKLKYTVIPEWKEINFGVFAGKTYEELSGNPDYQKWIDSGGEAPIPGGECKSDFVRRVMQGYERMKSMLTTEKEIVAVVHGGTIMALMSELDGGDYFSYMPENGRGYTIWI